MVRFHQASSPSSCSLWLLAGNGAWAEDHDHPRISQITDHWTLILWRPHYVCNYLCVHFAAYMFISPYPRPRNRLGSVEVRNCCAVLWAKRAEWRAHNLSSWRWRVVHGEVCKSRVTRQGSKMNQLPLAYVTCRICNAQMWREDDVREIGICIIKWL